MTDLSNVDICFNPTTEPFDLPELEGWPASRHQFDDRSIWAVRAALATGRPLLVRGEPGTGKSQLARAAAVVMKRPLLYEVVSSRTEVTDLLYQFDAVARLADAQILGASKVYETKDEVKKLLAPEKYIRPGRIWWAMNWPWAIEQAHSSGSYIPRAEEDAWKRGCVLLVDEIDKADSELPNALLECFANQTFQVPYLDAPVSRHKDQPPPLVVVTTNEERELPAPFLRRCLVLHLDLEEDDNKLRTFLIARGKVHCDRMYKNLAGYETVLNDAADQLISDRHDAGQNAVHKPGQAEYLDLCRAVFEIALKKECGSTVEILKEVAKFTLRKNPK
jgi:MoxR-like ATPase